MNKKATIFHWIVPAILVIILLATVLVAGHGYKSIAGFQTKGKWSFNFLENYYLTAEKDLLEIDYLSKLAVSDALLNLGTKGGFSSVVPCGHVDLAAEDYVLWNNKQDWVTCQSQIKKELVKELPRYLKKRLPQRKYTQLKFNQNIVTAQGDKKSIISKDSSKPYVKYTYTTGFRVKLDFDLEQEYARLRKEANNLVRECQPKPLLEPCIKKYIREKQPHWKLKDCASEKYVQKDKKVVFCVASPSKIKFYQTPTKSNPLQYKFALDFN